MGEDGTNSDPALNLVVYATVPADWIRMTEIEPSIGSKVVHTDANDDLRKSTHLGQKHALEHKYTPAL